jgi:hypothetical protein
MPLLACMPRLLYARFGSILLGLAGIAVVVVRLLVDKIEID